MRKGNYEDKPNYEKIGRKNKKKRRKGKQKNWERTQRENGKW